jgi:hypothetical protein
VGGNRPRCDFGRGALDGRAEVLAGQLRRVRVKAEADLAAALLDERRQPVCEGN